MKETSDWEMDIGKKEPEYRKRDKKDGTRKKKEVGNGKEREREERLGGKREEQKKGRKNEIQLTPNIERKIV